MTLKQLEQAYDPIQKMYDYGYFPVAVMFCLKNKREQILGPIVSFIEAKNALLSKYGSSEDGVKYTIPSGDSAVKYREELAELEGMEIDIEPLFEGICLDATEIEQNDKDLPPMKRLGFSANDWYHISKIIKVVEG